MKILSSPFSFRGKGYLGNIYRPYVHILIGSANIDEWIPVEMLVDTGADYTLLPKRFATLLGIDVTKNCREEKTYGVGGGETIYLCKNQVRLKINSYERFIPVGFLSRNDVPALLGRLGALELLALTVKERITVFEV